MQIGGIKANSKGIEKNTGNNISQNKDKIPAVLKSKPAAVLGVTLAALGILGVALLRSKSRSANVADINDIKFIKNKLGQSLAYKDNKLFSGVAEVVKNNKRTELTYKDGLIRRSVQKTAKGKFLTGKEYKYLDNGKLNCIEKVYRKKPDKLFGGFITETSTFTPILDKDGNLKLKYRMHREDYEKGHPVMELMQWEKDVKSGKVEFKKLSPDNKKVKTINTSPIWDSPRITKIDSVIEEDYTPHIYKLPGYDAPIQTIDEQPV